MTALLLCLQRSTAFSSSSRQSAAAGREIISTILFIIRNSIILQEADLIVLLSFE